MRAAVCVCAALVLCISAHARADDDAAGTDGAANEPTKADAPARADRDAAAAKANKQLQDEIQKLEEKNEDLEDKVVTLEEDLQYLEKRVKDLLPVKARLSGYLDFGFFAVGGDGSGLRSDIGNVIFPEYAGKVTGSWVFMGDPLSTAINSRGDPAETAESRAIVFDSVNNEGVASFIVNALNVQLFTGIGKNMAMTALFDLVPRSRDVSDPNGVFLGDFLDLKLAYTRWDTPVESFDLSVFAGKIDSVLGREYRAQEAIDRTTVTPSLICRYLCGRPLGVKARAQLLERKLVLNVAITNGSHFWEGFDFADEVDRNQMPTVAGRLSYQLPFAELELGVSGAYGAQDAQEDDDVRQWHIGGDVHLSYKDVELTAEYVQGRAQGLTDTGMDPPKCGLASCLEYKGAYGLLGVRLSNTWIPYARVDWRDALHHAGASFVYISKLWRATVGVRAEVGSHLIFKAEATVNRELGKIPQFSNDIVTTSMVIRY